MCQPFGLFILDGSQPVSLGEEVDLNKCFETERRAYDWNPNDKRQDCCFVRSRFEMKDKKSRRGVRISDKFSRQ